MKGRKAKRVGIEARSAQAPTPERAAKAGDTLRQDAVRAYHCEDAPIERLAHRGALAPGDAARNRILLEAANRYYEHWYLAGLSPLGAIDLTRTGGGDGTPAFGMPVSELAAYHRGAYRNALERLSPYFQAAVNPVVLEDQTIEIIASKVSGYKHEKSARAITLDRLRGGLAVLAAHFGMARLDAGAPTMQSSCHDSQSRSEATPRALLRHRSFGGM